MKERKHADKTMDRELISNGWVISRRTLLGSAALTALGTVLPASAAAPRKLVRFGMITDTHYATAAKFHKNKFYAEALKKVGAFVEVANEAKVDFIVELGDFINENEVQSKEGAKANLLAVEAVFRKFNGPAYHVLGNHDLSVLTKTEFNTIAPNPGIPASESYYSFNKGGVHFAVLDSNYSPDGKDAVVRVCTLSGREKDWLRKDLDAASAPVICFLHHPLSADGKALLKESGKALAVFQGHVHSNRYEKIGNTHYCHLDDSVAGGKVTDNAFAIVDVYSDNSITIKGYHRALNAKLTPTESEVTGVAKKKSKKGKKPQPY